MRQRLPNIFQATAFKKHISFLIDCKRGEPGNSSSKMFFFLSSTTGRKKKINESTMLIYIQLIVCMMILKITHLKIRKLKKKGLHPKDPDLPAPLIRLETRNCILTFMKLAAGISNNSSKRKCINAE